MTEADFSRRIVKRIQRYLGRPLATSPGSLGTRKAQSYPSLTACIVCYEWHLMMLPHFVPPGFLLPAQPTRANPVSLVGNSDLTAPVGVR